MENRPHPTKTSYDFLPTLGLVVPSISLLYRPRSLSSTSPSSHLCLSLLPPSYLPLSVSLSLPTLDTVLVALRSFVVRGLPLENTKFGLPPENTMLL
ncbi:hypothetical protein GBA52_023974 [Prunus armeniaca]|nr:hypothetical protein GBA52_023974 [Prunus armeniaca]